MRCAIVTASGLGDGLISMVLTHNLHRAGHDVACFSSPLCALRAWFPHCTLLPFPESAVFSSFDLVIAADHSCVQTHSTIGTELWVLKEDSFNKRLTLVQNLVTLCQQRLGIREATMDNGIRPPPSLLWRRHSKRVIVHPESTCTTRKWPAHHFIRLCELLARANLEPSLCVSPQERPLWQDCPFLAPSFPSLEAVAAHIYESGGLIGNNSGLGHLASCLHIPTLSLFARQSYANLWRPGWGEGAVLTAPSYLPGSHLKQRLWKTLITPQKVLNTYLHMRYT